MDELKPACNASDLKFRAKLRDVTLNHVKSNEFNSFFTLFKKTNLYYEISGKEKNDSVNMSEDIPEHSFEDIAEDEINDYTFDQNIVEEVVEDYIEENDYMVVDEDAPSPETTGNDLEICTKPDREERSVEEANETDVVSLDDVPLHQRKRKIRNQCETLLHTIYFSLE